MRLGVGSYLFRWSIGNQTFLPEHPIDAVGLIELAGELGIEVVQFAENLPLDGLDQATLYKVKATAERLGITLEAGTAGANVERLMNYLDIAQTIGAKLVRLSPYTAETQPSFEEILVVLRTVLPEYEKAGIVIAIENYFTMSSPDLVSLVNQLNTPFIGICLDTTNSIRQKEWPEETIRMLVPFALSLHLKDYTLETHPDHLGVFITGCALGDGKQSLESVIHTLNKAGRDVNIILEQWMPQASTIEETVRLEMEWIRKSIAYARSFIPVHPA